MRKSGFLLLVQVSGADGGTKKKREKEKIERGLKLDQLSCWFSISNWKKTTAELLSLRRGKIQSS